MGANDQVLEERVINYMRNHPIHWDARHPEYKDSGKKWRMLEKFGDSIGYSGNKQMTFGCNWPIY